MLEEKTNLRSKDIKGTETHGKPPATMNQTHQVIGTCAAHISWNLRSCDSEVELAYCNPVKKVFYTFCEQRVTKEQSNTTRFTEFVLTLKC